MNAGSHTTLFNDLSQWIGDTFPVAIVETDGTMVGWAMFHLTDVQGSSEKVIRGHFLAPVNHEALTIVSGGGSAGVNTGVTSSNSSIEVRLRASCSPGRGGSR